jgi:ABC-type antimicrobial peptide transport system permease subunit
VEESIRNILIEHGETDLKPALFLHPLLSWRLYSSFENGKNKGGMSDYVQLFSIIAIFILVIACINFMNLATARSERRAREVGIRKSVGSSRSEIMFQFVGESMLISLIAFLIALILVELSLPYYNTLVDKRLSLDYLSVNSWLFGLSIILVTGITAGSYPAFYLSSFQPIKVLKGKIKQGRKGTLPRKILVTLQFGFSIVLILGTIAIYQQIQLVKSRELGYDRNNLISIDYNNGIRKNYQVLKDGLLRTGVVAGVTKSNSSITSINSNNFVSWPGKPEDQKVIFTTLTAEYDYTKTMGIKMLEGRDFSTEFGNDTSSMIINKAALELMGLDDPLGTELEMWGNKYTLIGVMDDVMMGSPYEPVKPLAAIFDPEWVGTMTVRLGPTDDLQASLEKVKDVFLQYNPAYPFDYTFVDESFQKKFTTINMTSKIANLFAILTIIITVLGLFGLAAFTAEQRTKEIGIRKVLGASVTHIVYTMTQDFSRLVLFAFLLASPLAWWLLSKYLERYTIRTEIEWWFFVITGALAFILAATVVSTQAFKAARANPVKSLRSE